jgi:hypothetical protein
VIDELNTAKRVNLPCLFHDEGVAARRAANPIPPRRLDWAAGSGGVAFWCPPGPEGRAKRMRMRCGRVRRELS